VLKIEHMACRAPCFPNDATLQPGSDPARRMKCPDLRVSRSLPA
jgi:hypothetical protein